MKQSLSSLQSRSAAHPQAVVVQAKQRPNAPVSAPSATLNRREAISSLISLPVMVATSSLVAAQPAEATSAFGEAIGSFWKGRQTANSLKILAPIYVAKQRLDQAKELMVNGDANGALAKVRDSSLNCYVYEAKDADSLETKASLMTQSLNLGADPCTFRLIVKNITTTSPEQRLEGQALVASLINAYQKLDGELEAVVGGGSGGESAVAQMTVTGEALVALQTFVERILV